MKRVLITGASGFVGRALLERLRREGCEVVAAVRAVGTLEPRERLTEVGVGDLTLFDDWASLLQGVDAVVHLAARVHQMNEDAALAEARYRLANVEVTRRLAEAAQQAGVQRILFVSSIKVNGEGGNTTIRADDEPMPSDAYARSKCEAEALLRRLTATGEMKHIILRPPLMYGPGVKANMYALLRWVDRGRPWPFGAMKNRRSLLFVGNMADAIVTALADPRALQQTYLLADGPAVSTSDILRAVAVAMEQPIWMAPLSGRLAGQLLAFTGRQDLRRRLFGSLVVDGAPFCADTGWTPPSSLSDGLKATVAWYREEGRR
jgi:nucleoside-diphosphate-sugar epimerase